MQPDSMTFERKVDSKGVERLEIRYYDVNAQALSEAYWFSAPNDPKIFYYNYIRMHNRLPDRNLRISSVDEALGHRDRFRVPLYVVARKEGKFWKIREKIFL
jgi:DNA repair protein RadD